MQPLASASVGGVSPSSPSSRVGSTSVETPQQGASTNGASFKNALLQSIDEVNTMQHQAQQAVETLMTGGEADPAEVLTAVQKADLAFRMTMQMRNKMMEVYQEIKEIRI